MAYPASLPYGYAMTATDLSSTEPTTGWRARLPGLTLLAGPAADPWTDAAATLDPPFPLEVHRLDPKAAARLGINPTGASLVRPDAQVIACWPIVPPDPRAALLQTGWFGEPVSAGGGPGRWRRGRRP